MNAPNYYLGAALIAALAGVMTAGSCADRARPQPSPTPTAVPSPSPSPCSITEAALVAIETQRPSMMRAVVLDAQAMIGEAPTAGATPEEAAQAAFAAVADELRARQVCAIAGAEAVFVLAPDGLVEEFHVYSLATRKWNLRDQYVGVHAVRP